MNFAEHKAQVERELFSIWTPHQGQSIILQALVDDFLKGVFLRCGRKFSKTETAIVFGHLMCMYFPNSHGYYISDTIVHAGELVWHNRRLPDFFTNLRKYDFETEEEYAARKIRGLQLERKWVLKNNNSDMRKHFTNGSWFKVDGADNFGKANGMNPHFIIYDEFKLHDPRFHEAMEPNLTTNKAPILIVGTPPEGSKSYYSKIEQDFKNSDGYKVFVMPSYYNNYVYPGGKDDRYFIETKERYEKRGESDVFEREYLAKYVKGGHRAIFPVFESPTYDETGDKIIEYSRHVRPESEILEKLQKFQKDWDYFVSYDAGTVSCFAVLFGAINKFTKEMVFFDEIYEKDQSKTTSRNIYSRANKIKEKYHWVDDWSEIYDNAAAWFANEVHSEFENAALMPCRKDVRNKEHRLGMIKDAMIYGYFKCSERNKWFIWEIENYYIDEKGRIPKEDDHLIDNCFTGDTLITTKEGKKRIDSIEVGDMVLTRGGYRNVDHVWCNGEKKVSYCNGMWLTSNHKIYTLNRGFVEANKIEKGDILWRGKSKGKLNLMERLMFFLGSIIVDSKEEME